MKKFLILICLSLFSINAFSELITARCSDDRGLSFPNMELQFYDGELRSVTYMSNYYSFPRALNFNQSKVQDIPSRTVYVLYPSSNLGSLIVDNKIKNGKSGKIEFNYYTFICEF